MKKLFTMIMVMITMIGFAVPLLAAVESPGTSGAEYPDGLIHYWHFNDQVITGDGEVPADFSAVGQGVISYPGEGDGYMDFRSHRAADPVSNFNLRMDQGPDQGAILRVRNPAHTRELIVAAPSTGYEDLVVTFATTRSGSGAVEQEFWYSADNGATWVQVGDAYEVHEHDPEAENFGYVYKVFDLSDHEVVNNNAGLHFKIMAVGEGADGSSGNQRFDNFSLEGSPADLVDLIHYWHFNDQVITGDGEVPADFSAVGQGVITYPGEGDGYMDFRSHRAADPVSNFNLLMDQGPDQGAILRVRNPAHTRELIVAAPSTGYEDLVVTFATTRSGSGAVEQEFWYSADNGATWVQVGDAYEVHEHDPEAENFGYVYKVFDLSDHEVVNNNAGLHFKIMAVGEGADGSSGNQRFDNFSVDGKIMVTELPASKLSITAINEGDPVYVNEEFSITVYALNDDDIPTAVSEDTEVTLLLSSGGGVLDGTLAGLIKEGEMAVTIEGVTFDAVETGVSIKAEAEGLEPAISEEFDVHVRTYLLSLESFPPGAGILTGAGEYEAGTEVVITASGDEDYQFTHWSVGDEELSTDAEFTYTMPAEDVTIIAHFDMLGDVLLVHYWHFNNQEMITAEDYKVFSDFSLVGKGEVTYPGTGNGYMDFRSHRESDPVSNFNLRLGEDPDQGAVLRARNPAITRELLFVVPSTNFADLVVTFATTRTENGSQVQEFYFSADAGESWVLVDEEYEIPFFEDEEGIYLHMEFDLSDFEEVNDNPDLHFKILFVGEGNDNPSGNNRFDNFTVDGRALSDDVRVENIASFEPIMLVYPNPAQSIFHIESDEPGMLIRIFDMTGKLVYQRAMSGTTLSIDAEGFESGLYVIRGFSPSLNSGVTKRLIIP